MRTMQPPARGAAILMALVMLAAALAAAFVLQASTLSWRE